MSVVKINALEIPEERGDELVGRFLPRLEELASVPGFEGFELLRPTGETERRWFVYSRWASEEAYQAWRSGEVFARGHAGQGEGGAQQRPGPIAQGSSLLEFEVAAARGPDDG